MFDGDPLGPSLGGNREKLTASEYLRYGGMGVGLILLIVLYVFEFKHFDRTLSVKGLVISSIVVGLLLGLFLGYRFRHLAKDLTERVQIYVFFAVICMIFMPLLGNLSNRLLSFRPATATEVEFIQETPYLSDRLGVIEGQEVKPTGYYLFFYHKQQLHRTKNKAPQFPNKQRGDLIQLNIKKGLWGWEIIE